MKAIMRIPALLAFGLLAVASWAAVAADTQVAQYKATTTTGSTTTDQPATKEEKEASGGPRPTRKPAIVVPQGVPEPPPASPGAISCAWLGKRMVSLLIRDDAMGANDFSPFYQRFGCSEEQLAKTFACVVVNDGHGSDSDVLAARIDQCWAFPETRFEPPKEMPQEKPKAAPEAKEPTR